MVHQPMPHSTTNLLTSLEDSISPRTFAFLEAIADKASEIGVPLCLVGGSVRDILLAVPVKDLDLVVEGDAALLAFEVSKDLSGEVSDYSRFGTATVKLEGQRFDLATARRETYTRPGALPSVVPSTLADDLERRDFSINAMAIPLSGAGAGRLLDPLEGEDDLRQGTIRILHPGSFVDDATRILRAVRYEQRLRFRLEEDTRRRLLDGVEGGMLDTVGGDRIRQELALMLEEESPHLSLERCGQLGILRAIYPPLGDGPAVGHLADRGGMNDSLLYLAALSYPLSASEGEALIRRLHMPSRWAKVVRGAVAVRLKAGGESSDRPHIGEPGLSVGELCRFLDQFPPASVQVNALVSDSPQVKDALEVYLTRLRYVKPFLGGRDLVSLGVSQGPLVGEILGELKNARIDGRVTTQEEELRLAREYINGRGA